jgi:hypothetical protein
MFPGIPFLLNNVLKKLILNNVPGNLKACQKD